MIESLTVSPIRKFSKAFTFPGDKSISHRAVLLGAIAKGKTEIRHFLSAEDCLSTVKAFKRLGIDITSFGKERLVIQGKGLRGLRKPKGAIDLGNSGTSMRLLLGILAGQPFQATLKGDPSLSKRPMARVIVPLTQMGAKVTARKGRFPPLTIQGGVLRAIHYRLPIPSAQVKSAILLAGLYAEGCTTVVEPIQTRDHTERMLRPFGKEVLRRGDRILIGGGEELRGTKIDIPGDISSAAFFMVLSALLKGSRLLVKEIGLNPTRTGFIRLLQRMGAQIEVRKVSNSAGEPVGEIEVKGGELRGVTVEVDEIPGLIDELPILMVAAASARGETIFRKASELRVKETDRIASMVTNLKKMGISIWSEKDDVFIQGGKPFQAARLDSFKDHRTAMSLAIAGCLAQKGETRIRDVGCIRTSFPEFQHFLKS